MERYQKQHSAPKSTLSTKIWTCKKNDIKGRHQYPNSHSTLNGATTTTTININRKQYLHSVTFARCQGILAHTAPTDNNQYQCNGSFGLQAVKLPQHKQIRHLKNKSQQHRRDNLRKEQETSMSRRESLQPNLTYAAIAQNEPRDNIGVAQNKTILTGKWVFSVKTKADGTIDKFKARWVVRSFDQEHGRDFIETFAPVSRHTSLRILLVIAAMKEKKLRQIDVANAFLYAPVDAEIYVELPHGSHGEPNQVCQLQKSLYGIKQALRLWQQYLHARLTRIGFKQLPHDQGMYRLTKGDDYILFNVYVDDLLYIGSTDNVTTWFEGELQRDLTLIVSSTVTQYLGLNIQEGESAIYLNTVKYADTIAKRFSLTPTTISTPYRYTAGNNKAESAPLNPAGIRNYQRKLGCLLFAAVTCRPLPTRHLPQKA
ncbi:unnamed protein product [Closterium sp. NIES-54]